MSNQKIKELVHKLHNEKKKVTESKEKLGKPEIANVKDPHKIKPEKKKKYNRKNVDRRRRGTKFVGPRGGTYEVASTGKKEYKKETVKKSLEEWFREIEVIDAFINKFKEFKGLM